MFPLDGMFGDKSISIILHTMAFLLSFIILPSGPHLLLNMSLVSSRCTNETKAIKVKTLRPKLNSNKFGNSGSIKLTSFLCCRNLKC